jgi:hypothetical protein
MCRCLLATFLLAPLILGCQKGGGNVSVSGRITKDGQALPNAHVTFRQLDASGKPDPATEAAAETDDDGRYTLQRVQGGSSGAVPGKYRVEIQVIERTEQGMRKLIPPEFNEKSKLEYTVPPGGTKEADFDVKTK